MALSERAKAALLGALGTPELRDELENEIENITSDEIADSAITTAKIATSAVTNAKVATGIDAAKLANGSVSNTEFQYLDGVTSAIQTQLNAKQASGNYVTALTGDVTASGPGSVAATIASNAVTQAKLDPSVLKFTDVTLSTAQILALNGTPISVLAAPGAGICNVVQSVYATMDFVTAAYSASTDPLEIRYTNGAGAKAAELSNAFLEAAADARELVQPTSPVIPVENAALVAYVPNANPTTGDSDIKLRIFYRQVPSLL